MKNHKVCIIGAEGWGSAIATAVGKNALNGDFDARVHIYVYDELVRHNYLSEVMNDQHENIKYLPGIKLPKNLIAVNDLLEAAENADILIFATPPSFVKSYCNILEGKIRSTAFAVSMIKGLDHIKDGEIELFSQAISKQLEIPCYSMMCANSAMEMAQGKLCEITIGCNNAEHARVMTTVFQTDNCKVVATNDVHGVELCGTLKDIIALGAGFIDGLRLGDNARVAALHLGLKEMMRFVKTFSSTAKMSTFFESCGVANSVASSYADKNVTFAKNFVTSGKTVQEIESNLLNGQKLLGPVVAQEVYEFLKKKNMLDKFPLFVTIHKICQNKVLPMEIVEALRNHPDLNTPSISELLDEEHHMALKNATELMLENVADTIAELPPSLERVVHDATEKEFIKLSEEREDWSPFYQYFTAKEANRISQEMHNSEPFEEPRQLELKASAFGTEPFKMECRDDEQNISFLLEEPIKPIVACGTTTVKTSNSTNSSVYNDFRMVRKGLSTDNKGGSSTDSENISSSGTEDYSTQNNDHEDALDLSTGSKMDEWMIDNAWLSDQLPPEFLGKKEAETAHNFESKDENDSKANQDDKWESSIAQEIEKHLKPKDKGYQTLNVTAKTGELKGTEASATLDNSIVDFEESGKSAKLDAKVEDPFAAFEGIHNYEPDDKVKMASNSDEAILKALQEELAELELKHPKGDDPMVSSESPKAELGIGDETPKDEMQMIYDKDAMIGTDFKDIEPEIASLSNTMHLKETEFLQQELAKLHLNISNSNPNQKLSDDKSANFDVLMEQSEKQSEVQGKHDGLSDSEISDEQTFQDKVLKPHEETSLFESQQQLEETSYKNEAFRKVEETNIEDQSTKKSETEYLLYIENNKIETPKDESSDISLKSMETNVESFQSESQEEKYLEEKVKSEEKHLSSELIDFHEEEGMQFKEKLTQNIEYLVHKDYEKLDDLEPESPYTGSSPFKPKEQTDFQETNLNHEDIILFLESEDIRQEEKMQIEDKFTKPTEADSLDTSIRPAKPFAESFKHEPEEQKHFEEKSYNVEEKLSEPAQIRQVEDMQHKDKSTEVSDDAEKSKPSITKTIDDLQNSEDAVSRRVAAFKEEELINWLRSYTDDEKPIKISEKKDKEWDWLHNKEKIDGDDNIKDERRSEFYINEKKKRVIHSEEKNVPEIAPEESQSGQVAHQMSDGTDEAVQNEEKHLPIPVHEMKKQKVVEPGSPAAPVTKPSEPIHFTPTPQTQPQKQQPMRKNMPIKLDVPSTEESPKSTEETIAYKDRGENKEMKRKALTKEKAAGTDKAVQNEEKHLPIPVHEMKKQKVVEPGSPAAPVTKPSVPIHFTPTPQTQPQKQQPMRKNMPIKLDVPATEESPKSTEETLAYKRKALTKEKAASDRSYITDITEIPSDIKRLSQKRIRAERKNVKSLDFRVERKATAPESAEVDKKKYSGSSTKGTPRAKDAVAAEERSSRAAGTTMLPDLPLAEQTARPIRRKASHINRLSNKLNSIMRRGQGQDVDYKGSSTPSKGDKFRRKQFPGTVSGSPHFRKLKEAAGTNVSSHRRRAPIRPPFIPPLNPRVRTPQPPFDGRDHEYHTLARCYRSPPDLTRLHSLPNMQRHRALALDPAPKAQSKHLSIITLPKSSQARSPSFQIPKGLLRSPSLAKIVSAVQLGLLATFLTRSKQSDK